MELKNNWKHIKEILKKLPIIKTNPDFMDKLNGRIERYENKIRKSKGTKIAESSKR